MKTADVRWSCSAQIDLLGFSNQVMVTNCDIRTQIGKQAIERLSSLENAIHTLEQEKNKYPQLYPSGLHYVRFNDALFIGIDVEHLSPPDGQTTLTGGYSLDELQRIYPEKGIVPFKETSRESAGDVAKFLGLVARIHSFINKCEAEKSFPGCRTVVASGLRKCFKNIKGVDDFFSANFSVSSTFEAEKKGSSVGIKDNHLYVEDDVAMAISYHESCHAILAFSKFFRLASALRDPYQHVEKMENTSMFHHDSWIVSKPIIVDIMKKQHIFRRLNTGILTNLQVFEAYQKVAKKTHNDENLSKLIGNSLTTSTPSLEELNEYTSGINAGDKYPFLFLVFDLDKDYDKFFCEGNN